MRLRLSKVPGVVLGALSSVFVWLLAFSASAVARQSVYRGEPVPIYPSGTVGWVGLVTAVALVCAIMAFVPVRERRATRERHATPAQVVSLPAEHKPEERRRAA